MQHKTVPIRYLLGGFGAVLGCVVLLLFLLPNTMIPLMIAMAMAYAFDPLIDAFESRGCDRTKVVLWFFIGVSAVVLVCITILIPYLFIQAVEFVENLKNIPELLDKGITWASTRFDLDTADLKAKTTALSERLYSADTFSRVANWVKATTTGTTALLGTIFTALIIPVFFYYFLIDIDHMKSRAFRLIPKPYQSFAEVRLRKFDNVLSGFLRGQMTVACTLSVLYAIGLSLAGIKYGVLIGICAGLLNIVPYLGVGLGLVSSVLMAFFSGSLMWSLCGVGLVFGVVNTFEGFYLTPKIVGDKVGLTPITTIIIILIGGELFGVAGMLVAVPLGGIGRLLYRDLKAAYLKSNLYRKD